LADVVDFTGISRDFLADLSIGGAETVTSRIDSQRYIDDLLLRLALQWTELELDSTTLRSCIETAFGEYAAGNAHFDCEAFYLLLLEHLCRLSPRINPFYYDIGTDKVALRFPSLEIPSGPPTNNCTIEEPPFILLQPRRRPTP